MIDCLVTVLGETIIYPQQKCEAGFLLSIDCFVTVFGEMIAWAVEVIYVSFVNICMSLFSEVMMFEQVDRVWIVLSSRFCIVVSRQVNAIVVATA